MLAQATCCGYLKMEISRARLHEREQQSKKLRPRFLDPRIVVAIGTLVISEFMFERICRVRFGCPLASVSRAGSTKLVDITSCDETCHFTVCRTSLANNDEAALAK